MDNKLMYTPNHYTKGVATKDQLYKRPTPTKDQLYKKNNYKKNYKKNNYNFFLVIVSLKIYLKHTLYSLYLLIW